MVKETRKRWLRKERSTYSLYISGCFLQRDLGCLLALAGRYKSSIRFAFWGCLQLLWGTKKTQSRTHHLLHSWCVIRSHKHTHRVSKLENVHTETAERLEFWVFLSCPEDTGQAPKIITYGEWCQICDFWRRFSFRTRSQAWSLNNFYVAEFY